MNLFSLASSLDFPFSFIRTVVLKVGFSSPLKGLWLHLRVGHKMLGTAKLESGSGCWYLVIGYPDCKPYFPGNKSY